MLPVNDALFTLEPTLGKGLIIREIQREQVGLSLPRQRGAFPSFLIFAYLYISSLKYP